jgi:hypothetical protein
VASGEKRFEDLGMDSVERMPWACLLEVAFDGGIRGGAVLHSIVKGEAWKGLVVACFDCGKPGVRDWATGRSMVEMDKRADTGKVIRVGGLGG